jgi:hypothetical protein
MLRRVFVGLREVWVAAGLLTDLGVNRIFELFELLVNRGEVGMCAQAHMASGLFCHLVLTLLLSFSYIHRARIDR